MKTNKPAIVFKGKVVSVYNHDDTFSHKEVSLPRVFAVHHIENRQNHRWFEGKVSSEILNRRAKILLKDMGIQCIRLDQLPTNVTVTGGFMVTVRIEL